MLARSRAQADGQHQRRSTPSRHFSVQPAKPIDIVTSPGIIQPKCACGGSCPRCQSKDTIQAKLRISQPNDQYEQEADRVADQVMRMPDNQLDQEDNETIQTKPLSIGQGQLSLLQRQEDNRDGLDSDIDGVTPSVQCKSDGVPGMAGANFTPGLNASIRGGGQILSKQTRVDMEPRFGVNLSPIRIHTGARADHLTRSINAQAFTYGQNIFFRQGKYDPGSSSGRRLLAHELTHTIQNRSGDPGGGIHRIQRQVQPGLMRTPCTAWNGYASRSLSSYNCAGLAFRTYEYNTTSGKNGQRTLMQALTDQPVGECRPCNDPCGANRVKYWLWTYNISLHENVGGTDQPAYLSDTDFHIVAGVDPSVVYSKNGKRPVTGPAAGARFRPAARERVRRNIPSAPLKFRNGNPVYARRSNINVSCGCFGCT